MKSARLVVASALMVAVIVGGAGVASAAATVPKQAGPISGRTRTAAGAVTSTNWSGYAAYGATFSGVSGGWQQPSADCTSVSKNAVALSAFWVGLDGYFSNTVEQTGTEADCVGGSPRYYAWYEFYPHRLFVLSQTRYPVSPTDMFSATVSQANGSVIVTLEDHNPAHAWSFTTMAPAKHLAFSSAEWIAEGPSHELTNFGEVEFSAASASTGGAAQPINAFSNDAITMESSSGIVRATPSPPPVTGAFSIAWRHS